MVGGCSDSPTPDNSANSVNSVNSAVDGGSSADDGPSEPLPNSATAQAEVTLILENATQGTLYIADDCGPSFLTVFDADDAKVKRNTGCDDCTCEGGCAQCGRCQEVAAHELAPGETLERPWDGKVWTRSSSESCLRKSYFTEGTFTAEFCFGRTLGDDGIEDLGCVTETFELGVDTEVRHTVM